MSLIFPNTSSGVADNAFWEQTRFQDADGNDMEEWHFITDPARVEEEALRHVQNLFPKPLGWSPEAPGAQFPEGYAFAGQPVVSPGLAEILHRCDSVDFTGVLQPMTMDDFEQLLAQQTADSSPGMTGISYGHLRSMSRKHRLLYLQMANRLIQFQHCPSRWLEVAIALIPKPDGAQGLGAGRPISLIESLMKLATAWVAPRIKSALRAHRSPTDPPPPARPSGRLHSQQFFDSGARRGCHQALLLLTSESVMQAMTLQKRQFTLISTDVKGAFPGVPTSFMGQGYRSMGVKPTDRLYAFLQAIDVNSNIRVRVRHGFSRAVPKGDVGIHQGEVLSPGKYGWSLDPLLQYLDKAAAAEDLGIDLNTLCIDGQDTPFDGSYSTDTPNGTVTFYMQGGRLVAIAFADDVCLLAENMAGAQVLMNAAQEYYVAASATLCAPKSIYTSNHKREPWEIVLRLPGGAANLKDKLVEACWQWRQRRALEVGWRQEMPLSAVTGRQSGTVRIQAEWLFLRQLGDQVTWLRNSVAPPDFTFSLLHHLNLVPALKGVSITCDVLNRPLHLVNPKTGEGEYLKWVEPTESFRYLGIQISASLNWDAEYRYLLDQLNPILRQIKLGRKLGLAWDVLVQAASARVMGLVSYHATIVPFSPDRMATLNNKITEALKITAEASPHHMRCPQPVGLGIPDMTLRAAQTRIQLALTTLHSSNMEGQALRWCLRVIQLRSAAGCFPWEDATFWHPPAVQGFAEAVSQSLQQVVLRRSPPRARGCGRTRSDLVAAQMPSVET
jgi:hypothetical protein